MIKILLIGLFVLILGCTTTQIPQEKQLPQEETLSEEQPTTNPSSEAIATFSGGCFWCMESALQELEGVNKVISGYTGGDQQDPTYKEVSSGTTSHIESIQVYYDPSKISYKQLLDFFWMQINPTDNEGQFVDRGQQYTSAIFYHNEEQKQEAEASKAALEASGKFDKPIVTPIRQYEAFYSAEDYHQDYYKTHSVKYKFYRYNSGRDQFLDKTWGKDRKQHEVSQTQETSLAEKKQQLTPLQYKITQEDGTEKPFDNEYWDNKVEGIYVDIVSGEPLFSSKDKYKSGTGWPSFTQPLESKNIVEKEDNTLFTKRTEVRSKEADSHLGHIFNDGPQPTGLRYCMNSAAMKFIKKEDLEKEGYEEYVNLFEG